MSFLQGKIYAGANDEFLRAHEHYRHQRYKECLNECLKAFESTMKAICKKRRWTYSETDTAKTFLDICLKNGLIEPFWQSHFTGLRATLESGIPTVRNKTSGHGQGTDLTTVPPSVASYVLHLTTTILLFLTNAEKDLSWFFSTSFLGPRCIVTVPSRMLRDMIHEVQAIAAERRPPARLVDGLNANAPCWKPALQFHAHATAARIFA